MRRFTRFKSWAAIVVALTAIASQTAHAEPAHRAGTAYYIDAQSGNDSASGLDSGHAWRTLARVNSTTFQPGDRILLRAGSRWTGQLWPKGSGTSAAPVTIDRFGTGAAPRVDGAGQVADAVRLSNQQFWTIRALEVTNQAPATGTPGQNLKDLRGIHVTGDKGGRLEGFVVDGVHVHDVTGEVNWIGGDTAGDKPGIRFKTGWDRSKKTGGIVFDTGVPNPQAPPATPTTLHGITVQNSVIANTSFAGIVVKQYNGDAPGAVTTGWGNRTKADDPKFAPHTNVFIRGNHISHPNTEYGCNGMYITNVRHAVIERNVVNRTGTSGIETYFADDVTIQFNEVSETRQRAGGADSNGIDPDKGTTRQVVQYNYTHDNGDGILLCQFVFGDVVVRYNVIARNTRYQIYLHSDPAARASVHNNTIYNTRSNYAIYGYGKSLQSSYNITNNVIYSTVANAALTTSSTVRYRNNLYGGATLPVPGDDTNAVKDDPRFVASLAEGTGTPRSGPRLDVAHALKVRFGSPAIDRGAQIVNPGSRDFAGTPLYTGKPDIGAFEHTPSADRPDCGVDSAVSASAAGVKVWLAGDSTMADPRSSCPVGWGGQFDPLFKDDVTVVNNAVAGRSIQTWLYESNVKNTKDSAGECVVSPRTFHQRWHSMLDPATGMKAGDYLMIQFGINDGDPNCPRHVGSARYQELLALMAKAAKDRGVTPIFLSPVSAIRCSGNSAVGTRGFLTETANAGRANQVTVIDLHKLSYTLYNTLKLCPNNGDYTSGPVGAFFCNDHTHFEAAGARQIAGVVAKALRDRRIPLATYLK